MPAFSPLSPTDLCNLALAEIGVPPISDIDDNSNNSGANAAKLCAKFFWPSVLKVAREHNWNCLQRRVSLPQLSLPQSSSSECTSMGWSCGQPSSWPPYWLANTPYTGATLVTYGEAVYYCLTAYTSSDNFIVDLTAGYWAQLYQPAINSYGGPGGQNGYEWNFGYILPSDYVLLTELNGNNLCGFGGIGSEGFTGRGVGSLYEIFVYQTTNPDESSSNVRALFCNTPYANIKYTALIQDTTLFDPHFVDAVSVFLAGKLATVLRADDGRLGQVLRARYRETLAAALMKDSGERKFYRYDPCKESQYLASRYGSTAG